MIDTDKYEWDSKCRLVVIDGELFQRGANGDYHITDQLHDKAVAQIVADAPLLLQEVKRLYRMIDGLQMDFDHDAHIWFHDEGWCEYLSHPCAICDSMESDEE